MINLPIEIGDLVLGGRFKNKKIIVKEIGYDEYGLPTVNGRGILKIRIPKLYQKQQKKESLDQRQVRASLIKTNNGDWILYDDSKDQNIDSRRFKTKDEARVYANDHAYKIINIQENRMKKLRKEGSWGRTLKVKVKKEGDRYYNYLIKEDDEDECLTPVGFETKELAKHAAMTKGYIVDEKMYEDEQETSEPMKPTNREKTPGTEKPKEEKLSKGTELKLEGLIRKVIKEEIKKKKGLKEANLSDKPELEAKARRYAELAQKMKLLEAELKELEKEYEPLDVELREQLEVIGTTKDTFIRAGKLLIKIERAGYDKSSKSYKTGFEYLYNKVNGTMKELADDALKMTEGVSYVKSKISVVEEGRLVEGWMDKIKNFFSKLTNRLFGLNNKVNKELDALEKAL